jgi:hypothetical protein
MQRRPELLRFCIELGVVWTLASCGGGVSPAGPTPGAAGMGGTGSGSAGGAGVGGMAGGTDGGAGLSSTACALGANDPVAGALCASPLPTVRGLAELYRALHLETFLEQRLRAATTHSLGLSSRIVSAINPRVFVFSSFASPSTQEEFIDSGHIAAVAFARGEQMVELVGYDPLARDFNFYLLKFEQACNRTRCAPADLLSAKIETEWTGWTLYADRDLEDTPLDCLSCHRPDGASAPKRLLMRQLFDPWMHWSGFQDFFAKGQCDPARLPPDAGVPGDVVFQGEGIAGIERVVGTAGGSYAGIPIDELSSAASGHDLSSFIVIAGTAIEGVGFLEAQARRGEPHQFDSKQILCERAVGRFDTWQRYRSELFERGLPVPHRGLDVLDSTKRAEATTDLAAFLSRNAATDAFELASGLMSAEAQEGCGFVPAETDDAPTILRRMCVRCHDSATEPRLRRARFNAEALDRLDPEKAATIWRRVTASRSSPELMPPLRAGELPSWAVTKIEAFLREQTGYTPPPR